LSSPTGACCVATICFRGGIPSCRRSRAVDCPLLGGCERSWRGLFYRPDAGRSRPGGAPGRRGKPVGRKALLRRPHVAGHGRRA
jgi:hypothetical protein